VKKRTVAIGILAISVVGLTSVGGTYAFGKWRSSQPSKENFDKVIRALWEKENKPGEGNSFSDPAKQICISIPYHPAPDARSKVQMPLAWHLDFFTNAPPQQGRETQLLQLDALTSVGLLQRSTASVTDKGETREAIRYGLTDKGWAATGFSRGDSCFALGAQRYLGITRFEPKAIGSQAGLQFYEVYAKVGLASENDLSPWARDPKVQAAFPEIRKNLDGQEFVVALVLGEGGWVEYQKMLMDEMLKKSGKGAEKPQPANTALLDDAKRQADELRKLPPPTVEEVKKILQASHGVGDKVAPWPTPCLDLPGSEKLPVDKDLSTSRPARYEVAIFTNKPRTTYDPVGNKTIPYLNQLEQLGIVGKRRTSGFAGEVRDAGAIFEAEVFQLSQAYERRIAPTDPFCFPLGEPSVEFVDLQIAAEPQGTPFSQFRYKIKVMYKAPPAWMNEPSLKNGWAELSGVLERGRACSGEFGFDRRARTQYGGAGSCWWAFDSIYENY
jgi:hypothetical protein